MGEVSIIGVDIAKSVFRILRRRCGSSRNNFGSKDTQSDYFRALSPQKYGPTIIEGSGSTVLPTRGRQGKIALFYFGPLS